MTGTVTVLGVEDLLDETNETFSVVLSSPSNATITDGTGAGTILDDDGTPTLNISDTSASEGDTMIFTASLSSLSASPVTFDYTTVNGTAVGGSDYTIRTGSVTIPAATASVTISITGLEDTTYEGNETFSLVASNVSASATPGDLTGSATILEDDTQPAISINDTTTTEGGTLSFTVSLSNPSTQNVSVSYLASGVTATSGTDYTHT